MYHAENTYQIVREMTGGSRNWQNLGTQVGNLESTKEKHLWSNRIGYCGIEIRKKHDAFFTCRTRMMILKCVSDFDNDFRIS